MATDILTIGNPDFDAEPNPRDEMENLLRALVRQLELDGYVFRKNKLYPIESSVIDEQREQTYLDALIDTLNLPDPATIKHHMGFQKNITLTKSGTTVFLIREKFSTLHLVRLQPTSTLE